MKAARNTVAGALSGLGCVVLLQQFSVLYPTATVAFTGIALGIAVQFGVSALVGRPQRTASIPLSSADVSETPNWHPTHRVPADGTDAWPEPDASARPELRLDGGLEVRIDKAEGGWAHVVCENGWSTWVNGSLLEPRG